MNILKDWDRFFLGGTRLSKSVPTNAGLRAEVRSAAFNAVYDDDELYARHLRAQNNLGERFYGFEIFDELPEGWTTCLQNHGHRGLRGKYDNESKYVWCETNVPMYVGEYPSNYHINPEYRQSLVRRK